MSKTQNKPIEPAPESPLPAADAEPTEEAPEIEATAGAGAETEQLAFDETGPDGKEGPSPRLLAILESILFASDRPLKVSQLRKVLGERSPARVRKALDALVETRSESGIVVMEVAGGYQLRTNPDHARWVRKLETIRPARMSRASLEVLAVIAYRQPLTRVEIDEIRGVDCGAVLKHLLARDLIRILGRKEEPGRPFLYGTTDEFLSFFSLANLSELPPLRDVEELAEEQKAEARRKLEDEAEDEEESGDEIEAAEIAIDPDEDDDGGPDDEELAAALAEASDAAAGADAVRHKLREMAREQPLPGEAGQALRSLEQLLEKRKRRKKKPAPEPETEDATEAAASNATPEA